MPDYRRNRIEGGCYFFTVNLLERYQNQLLVQQIDILRMDYLHYNPVKHGYVDKVMDWPYSTFRHHVQRGLYSENWGVGDIDIRVGEPG